jgi:hypothetical protein
VYYHKKLDCQEARVKELLKRPACMLTGLGLSRNLNSQQDYDKCMTYYCWFQTFIEENPGILDYTWFSDGVVSLILLCEFPKHTFVGY